MGGTWIGVWIFVIGYGGGDFGFIIFCRVGGGMACFGILRGQILLFFFTFFLNNF